MQRPNPYDTWGELFAFLDAERRKHGFAYLWLQRDAAGRVEAAWAAPSDEVERLPDGRWRINCAVLEAGDVLTSWGRVE